MRPKHLPLIAALMAAGSLVAGGEPARAGGTSVIAPERLGPADCAQGVHPQISGVGHEIGPTTIGCAQLSDGDEVLVAVGGNGHGACFYAPLAGDQHVDGPCVGVRVGTPLTRDGGVESLSVRKPEGGSGAYVGGVVPSAAAHVLVRYRTKDGGTREWPARLIRVREPLAGQLGARRPFTYFVGEIPKDADACRRLLVEGRGSEAELVASDRLSESTVLADGISVPGSKDCKARRAATRGAADTLGGAGTGLGAAVVS